jgi:uncharacterized protein (TIGR02246 family)
MTETSPSQIHREFEAAFNAGDEEALLALYEPEAAFVAGPGQVLTDKDALRAALQQFLALKGQIKLESKFEAQSGDLALLINDWKLTGGTGPDGKPVEMSGRTTEVVRRQPDGRWIYVIDNPFGEQILG